jgi:hypothetical protein
LEATPKEKWSWHFKEVLQKDPETVCGFVAALSSRNTMQDTNVSHTSNLNFSSGHIENNKKGLGM